MAKRAGLHGEPAHGLPVTRQDKRALSDAMYRHADAESNEARRKQYLRAGGTLASNAIGHRTREQEAGRAARQSTPPKVYLVNTDSDVFHDRRRD